MRLGFQVNTGCGEWKEGNYPLSIVDTYIVPNILSPASPSPGTM